MRVIILDTETTGLPPKGEACEIAYIPTFGFELVRQDSLYLSDKEWLKLQLENGLPTLGSDDIFYQQYMPKGDFHPKASECNGFTKEKLAGSPCISTFVFPTDVTYMIGHNIMFDYDILKKPKGVKLICTKELAVKYLTKTSGAGTKGINTLTGLIERYYPEEAQELNTKAHSALQDCKLCYLILLKVLEAAPELDSFEKLAAQCKQPAEKEEKLPFGVKYDSYTKQYVCAFGTKHKDKPFLDILKQDKSYLLWIVEKSAMKQDLKDWIKKFLQENK